jgi:hypothetical protein
MEESVTFFGPVPGWQDETDTQQSAPSWESEPHTEPQEILPTQNVAEESYPIQEAEQEPKWSQGEAIQTDNQTEQIRSFQTFDEQMSPEQTIADLSKLEFQLRELTQDDSQQDGNYQEEFQSDQQSTQEPRTQILAWNEVIRDLAVEEVKVDTEISQHNTLVAEVEAVNPAREDQF